MIGELTIDMECMARRPRTTVVISYKHLTVLKHFKFEFDDQPEEQSDELIQGAKRMINIVWLNTPVTKKEIEDWFYGQPYLQLIRAVSPSRTWERVDAVVTKEPETEEAKVVGSLVQGIFDSLFGNTP